MPQNKHFLYQGWMSWSHTQTKRHNNRPIMSCVAVQWRRQGWGERGREGGNKNERASMKMSERGSKWASVLWLHAEGQSCTFCALFRSHFTWPERMLSNQQALQRYSINIHIFTFMRSKANVSRTHAKKRNISTQARAKKTINYLRITSGHCLEYTPSKTIFHEHQTWRLSQLKASCLTHIMLTLRLRTNP